MIALAIIAALTLASAAFAMSRRNLIHTALLLIVTWAGIASFYLWAGAEFVAFAQLLIYVGAVSMVVLFAVLLTRRSTDDSAAPPAAGRRVLGAAVAGSSVAAVLGWAILNTTFAAPALRAPSVNVRQLGFQLMGPHAASLLAVGIVLTVALIGATVIASSDAGDEKDNSPRGPLDVPNSKEPRA